VLKFFEKESVFTKSFRAVLKYEKKNFLTAKVTTSLSVSACRRQPTDRQPLR